MTVELIAIPDIPLIKQGDDLVAVIAGGLKRGKIKLHDGDIFVLAQKIISKAEGRLVDLATVEPTDRAIKLANSIDKDPRLVELVLSEAIGIVATRPGLLLVEHKCGFVMPNAGIDQSNIGEDGHDQALLLPVDPDASAAELQFRLQEQFGKKIAVIINDSVSRPWRAGTCGVAIGSAGLPTLNDLRGSTDLFGRKLQFSISGFVDEIAAAASLVMGQRDEGLPIVIVRGLQWDEPKSEIDFDNAPPQLLQRPSVTAPQQVMRV